MSSNELGEREKEENGGNNELKDEIDCFFHFQLENLHITCDNVDKTNNEIIKQKNENSTPKSTLIHLKFVKKKNEASESRFPSSFKWGDIMEEEFEEKKKFQEN